MILADKILTLRKSAGWSQEELAEKLNVSRQSISKWESAASIPEINKILEMAKLFGVSTDYLLKDEIERPDVTASYDTQGAVKVTLNEAQAFVQSRRSYAARIGLGAMLCILSPVLLIFLTATSGAALWGGRLSVSAATAAGLAALLIMVAAAVAIFILSDLNQKQYAYLKEDEIELEYGTAGILREKWASFKPRYAVFTVVGVILCILSPLPLILSAVFGASDVMMIALTCLLLTLVSVAVYMLIYAGVVKGGFDLLLEEGDYSPKEKERNKRAEKFGGFYWPVIVAIYLAYSFLTGRWDISWVIWPVAALLFAGISALFGKEA